MAMRDWSFLVFSVTSFSGLSASLRVPSLTVSHTHSILPCLIFQGDEDKKIQRALTEDKE